jgi:ubiquitin-conjugating enzyme E2 J1
MSQSTTTTKRLLREAALLANNPSSTFHAGPVSDSNLHEWHFTLLGPSDSPFEGGLYHGRITLPPSYPLKAPSFRFLTPSGRFEPNREICLSISNFHEESWNPAWDVRTALTALRPFMASEGEGQVGGVRANAEIRRKFALASRGWRCEACGGKRMDEILPFTSEDEKRAESSGSKEEVPALKFGYRDQQTAGQPAHSRAPSQVVPVPEDAALSGTNLTVATPTRTSTTSVRTRPATTPRRMSRDPHSQDHHSVWLDAAIAGVAVMILILLLRKLAVILD